MKKITKEVVSNTPFPTQLSVEEQERMVAALEAMENYAEKLRQLQIDTRSDLKALMPALVDRALRNSRSVDVKSG